ncbi:hypothetical protein [Xanthocytophaga agilis]|uniref:GLPGLI family protein n=1 Tax=Xanthocytophaga agilis TaxID=3048010 RepID=A0AAE3UFS8_9BACT|nr:hypothetical protein [Xanthocytophaga agilis]MDJ1503610.1 hypothetical protein [Xanthocytophaga agilis]
MKPLIVVCIIYLLSISYAWAQIYTDTKPINPYFTKIEYVALPEPETGKAGVIFFTCDTAYINAFMRDKARYTIEKISNLLYYNKFKRNKFRYNHYETITQEVSYRSAPDFKTFIDSVTFSIFALKNKRRWNWLRFRFDLIPLSTDRIYAGTITSRNFLQPSTTSFSKQLTYDSVTIRVFRNGLFLEKQMSVINFPNTIRFLLLNFDDYLIRLRKIDSLINTSEMYIKPGKNFKEFFFYCPVRLP